MIALALLMGVGVVAQRSAFGSRRVVVALLAALLLAMSAALISLQLDVVTAWGQLSGPYFVSLCVLAVALGVAIGVHRLVDNAHKNDAGVVVGGGGEQGKKKGTHAPRAKNLADDVLSRFLRHRIAVGAFLVLALLCEMALWAGIFERALGVDHALASAQNRFAPAGFPHLLGTDQLSRDEFVRLCFGGRISLTVGLVAATLSAIVGATIGLYAGTRGGVVDVVLMRLTDAMLSIPVLPLLLITSAVSVGNNNTAQSLTLAAYVASTVAVVVIGLRLWARATKWRRLVVESLLVFAFVFLLLFASSSALSSDWVQRQQIGSVVKIIVLIVAFGWMSVARLARAAAIELKHREFVVAARALGASEARVIALHILPSALAPILVAATLDVGANILYEAALSYLGLGVKPPVASWGNMLNNALVLLRTHPALAFWPGAIILLTVTCFNLVGDALTQATNPRSAS